ncbi:hypothetical protein VF05_02590 [Nostoc linckia z3]|nr:hypothetical protein VF05_02590 [Nostoc linckia z3]
MAHLLPRLATDQHLPISNFKLTECTPTDKCLNLSYIDSGAIDKLKFSSTWNFMLTVGID